MPASWGWGRAQGALTGGETAEQVLQRIDAASPGWFAVGLCVALAMVVLGSATGQSKRDNQRSKAALGVRLVLGAAAFTLWTTALPGSWPYGWNVIRDMGAAYAILLVPLGLIFAGVAEWALKQAKF